MQKKLYFENLDGLKFLCFLSVFFFHSFHTEFIILKNSPIYSFIKKDIFGNGNIGVNFFFVISGFLITFLLIEEKKLNGQISINKFWLRRILRIWPLFYFCVFFGFIIFPFLKHLLGQTPNETANYINYLTFTNNFDLIKLGLPDCSVLGVLWSIAIEEQFYFVWPLIIYFFSIKKLWIPFILIILVSILFRALNDSPIILEHHTLSCMGDMTVGALGAWLINMLPKFKTFVESFSKKTISFIYIIFVLIFFFRDELLLPIYGIRIFERILIASIILF
ncbi:MAG: acyltransferase [Bacteroidetes bacterium]|nr:acyltransferase [Bacteroidota bacterium]